MTTEPLFEEPELVNVFETTEEPEALVVQSLLQAEGNIDSIITGVADPEVMPGVGPIMVRVPVEHAAEAKAIIEQYRTYGDPEAADFPDDISEQK